MSKELEDIKSLLREMFQANHDYGCGWYGDDRWRTAYAKLQKVSGYKETTSVLGEYDKFDDLPDMHPIKDKE